MKIILRAVNRGGTGSGNFDHEGGKGGEGNPGGSSSSTSNSPAKLHQVANSIYDKIVDVPDDEYSSKPISKLKDGSLEFSVHNFGDWKSTPERRHEEDDDYKIPTPKTVSRLNSIVAEYQAKHPNLKVEWFQHEKQWISFHIKNK